jgi:(p)ppGpp synthase/HD superfamily hydrolase
MAKSQPTISETRAWVAELHATQTNKDGEPYFRHLERVATILEETFSDATDDQIHAAYLHDAMEDQGLSRAELVSRGYSSTVISTVKTVTKKKDKLTKSEYRSWVRRIISRGSVDAIRVKFADMSDNFDECRLSKLEPNVAAYFRAKYTRLHKKLMRAAGVRKYGPPKPIWLIQLGQKSKR